MTTPTKPKARPTVVVVQGYGDARHLSFDGETLACNTSHVYDIKDLNSNVVDRRLSCGHCKHIAKIEADRLKAMIR